MNLFKPFLKLGIFILASFLVSCSPRLKVERYSYLLKNKEHKEPSIAYQKEKSLPKSLTDKRVSLWDKTKKPVPQTQKKTYNRKNYSVSMSVETPFVQPPTKQVYQRPSESLTDIKSSIETPIAKTEQKESISVMQASQSSLGKKGLKTDLIFTEKETDELMATANSFLGVPYLYAGMSSEGIDCSGLIYQSYQAINIELPRNSQGMANCGSRIRIENAYPGTLLFFHSYKGKGINHVGMVSRVERGEIEFIHATVTEGVRVDKLSDPYWNQRFKKAVVPDVTKKSTALR